MVETFAEMEDTSDLLALARGRVLVCGAGGLGSWVLEMLARSGVGVGAQSGFVRVVDPDRYEESNLDRQLFATRETLGQGKAEVACRRICTINDQINVQAVPKKLTSDNAVELLTGCDVAIDATDNVTTRIALEEAAEMAGVPLVHGSVGGLYGQVAVVRPGDGLLRRLYREASPAPRPTTASAVAAVAAPMAQACCELLHGGDQAVSIPPNALLTIDLHTLCRPCRLIQW